MELRVGELVIQAEQNHLVAGVFQSDDCVLLRPRGRTYVTKNYLCGAARVTVLSGSAEPVLSHSALCARILGK